MLILLLEPTRQVYSRNVVIIADKKCRDKVSEGGGGKFNSFGFWFAIEEIKPILNALQ